jgi:hypothetical protein
MESLGITTQHTDRKRAGLEGEPNHVAEVPSPENGKILGKYLHTGSLLTKLLTKQLTKLPNWLIISLRRNRLSDIRIST